MLDSYWLGLLTLPALILVGYMLIGLGHWLASSGWFLHLDFKAMDRKVSPWLTREIHGWQYLHLGVLHRRRDWGSRWVRVGPLTVGRKSEKLVLLEAPPQEMRTEPGEGESWAWGSKA